MKLIWNALSFRRNNISVLGLLKKSYGSKINKRKRERVICNETEKAITFECKNLLSIEANNMT